MRLSKRRIAIFGAQIASILGLFLAWQLLVQFKVVSNLLVASPSQVIPNFLAILTYKTANVNVPFGIEETLGIVALGVVIAVSVGFILGATIGSIDFLRNVLEEYIVAVYSLPKASLLPLFWVFFGITLRYRLAYGAIEGAFPVVLIAIYATRSIDPALMKMAKAAGASRLQRIFKVSLPSIIPSVMGGIRIGFVGTFTGVILAEMWIGNTGIGFLVRNFTDIFETTSLYGIVLAVILTSVSVNIALLAIEKYLTRWKTASPI